MKVAAFSGVFMDHSLHFAMKQARKLGFDGMEIACREPHLSADTSLPRVREIKHLAEEYGLHIPVLAGYAGVFSTASDRECERSFAEFQKLLEWASLLEADMIRVFPGGPNAFLACRYHDEKAAHWLRKCVEQARGAQKKIVLEIHNASLVETVEGGLGLLNRVGDDANIGLIHDAGNMYITDTDYGRNSVHRLGRRLFHVHVKDVKRVGPTRTGSPGTFTNRTRHGEETFRHCPLGEGEVDHRPLLKALEETGYGGWITLECGAPGLPDKKLAHDFQVLKRWLNA